MCVLSSPLLRIKPRAMSLVSRLSCAPVAHPEEYAAVFLLVLFLFLMPGFTPYNFFSLVSHRPYFPLPFSSCPRRAPNRLARFSVECPLARPRPISSWREIRPSLYADLCADLPSFRATLCEAPSHAFSSFYVCTFLLQNPSV